jgi:hypothetical protein
LRDVHLVLLELLSHPLYGRAALETDNHSPVHRLIRVSRDPEQASATPGAGAQGASQATPRHPGWAPVVALGIAALAMREGTETWHGEDCGC